MRRLLLPALILLSSATALAQEEEESAPLSAAPIEQKTGPKLNEVEHGFFVGASAGLALAVSEPADVNGLKPSLSTGQSGGIELGFEPTPVFSIGVLAWGTAASTPSQYLGTCAPTSTTGCPHGNFTALTLGADARLNLSLGPDANDVRRAYFFIRAGAGFSILSPKGLLANEPVVFGGPGFEYFTHLRHFSIGIEADGSFGVTNKGLGVMIQPLVRYTF